MPFVNGTWVDDATSVPDAGMPPGMGDPTGAIVPAPQQTPMAPPQQIMPRPIPGGPQPPPIPPMLLNPAAANVTAEPVSPELTPAMVNQDWAKINRPPEWDAGRIASTIAKLPVTLPIQLIEGVRGLLGGDTIQGWAEQADARYSDPNYSESRAFGVKGIAKEPDYGDRWTGIITGKSQEGALHGKLMRQEIGRYTKQRSEELKNFSYVGDIYSKAQNLYKTGKELEFLPEEQQFKRDEQQRARERLGLYRQKTGLEMLGLNFDIGAKRDKAAVRQWIDANIADPQARAALYQKYGLSDLLGSVPVPGGALPELQRGAIAAGDIPRGPEMLTPEQDAIAGRELETAARLEAAATAQERNRQAQRNTAVDLTRGQRDPAGPNIDFLQELLGRVSGGSLGIPSEAQDFAGYDAETRRMQAEAYRSRGLPVPANLVAPTSSPGAAPTPTPSALVDRIDTMTPEDKALERLQREAEAAVPTPATRPTPMATPRPPGTTNFVDLDKAPAEATRQAEATTEARLKEDFLLNWVKHEGWNAPRSGARWDSKWSAFMAANGR